MFVIPKKEDYVLTTHKTCIWIKADKLSWPSRNAMNIVNIYKFACQLRKLILNTYFIFVYIYMCLYV